MLRTLLASAGALLLLVAMPCASALSAESAVSPLPASEYSVRALCQRPSFGSAACLGLRLVAKTPQAVPGARVLSRPDHSQTVRGATHPLVEFKEPFKGSLTPGELRGDYNLNGTPSPASTQTIGIVDAYDDPTAEADLEHYDRQFNLPPCTRANGCFHKLDQAGNESPLPASNQEGKEPEAGWALEISTDIEVARGVCESCHILLVEADSTSFSDLTTAEKAAEHAGATEISNSWGGPECAQLECVGESSAFSNPGSGVVITVAAGDFGYRSWDAPYAEERDSVDYPASSPNVVAVGGTRLTQKQGIWERETVWNDGGQSEGQRDGYGAGGGGCSASFAAQSWQQSVAEWKLVGCGTRRAVSDISADADPYTGIAVYDSTPVTEAGKEVKGWNILGGTSVASPIIASVFALAGGAQGAKYPAQTLYENAVSAPSSLHDVTVGSNGECLKPFNEETAEAGCSSEEEAANSCTGQRICFAKAGYDGPSGLGTPDGITAFQPSEERAKRQTEEKQRQEKLRQGEREREERPKEGGPSVAAGGNGPPSGGSTSRTSGSGSTAGTSAGANTIRPGEGGGGEEGGSLTARGNAPIKLSAFALTPNALLALNRARPKVSALAFAFTLSAATHVRVTLAKLLPVRGRNRWKPLPGTLAFAATKGRNRRSLTDRSTLARGRYRLTLTPQNGSARSLTFRIG